MSDTYIGGPVARTALQAMYAASRKLGREGVLAVVNSLTQPALPGSFRAATVKYLVEGRSDNAEHILASLREQEYTELGDDMISLAEKLRREGKLEGEADGLKKGKAEGLAEALIRQLQRKFELSASDLEHIRTVRDVTKLQAGLDEIIEPGATRESVLEKLHS
ncbi:MAG: hypothetical protein EA428_00105 [Spirochaetaceae bacterium]|nr:MAG: hypothetical protein EA428_00105 [Spirochaetaceae bacterium]